MTEALAKIPTGMRYFFGSEARRRRAVENAALAVFTGWSYEEIATPSVDYYSLFARGMGHAEAHRAFRFTDLDGGLVALRPDVTSTVARAAATLFAGRLRPLRLCYAAPVFRQQTPSAAEYRREIAQLGCELIGGGEPAADLEVLAVAAEVFAQLGVKARYCITLNTVEIFHGIAEGMQLNAEGAERMRQLVDARETYELERFLTTRGATPRESASFARLTALSGKGDVIAQAREIITNPRSAAALDRLEELWRAIVALGLDGRFELDLGDISGLDYYTGLTFKIYLPGAGTRVGSGGRYDRLIANFGPAEPAVGFVLDLDLLTSLAGDGAEPEREPRRVTGADTAALFKEALSARAAGERIQLDLNVAP